MSDFYGRMMVDFASIWVMGAVGVDMAELDADGELIAAMDDFVSVRAYQNGLYTGVRVVTHTEEPPVDDLSSWEAVEEISVLFTAPPYLFVPLTERDWNVDESLQDLELDPAHYRIRCHTRGGPATGRKFPFGVDALIENEDEDPASYLQQFRLDFWVDSHPQRSGTRAVLKDFSEHAG